MILCPTIQGKVFFYWKQKNSSVCEKQYYVDRKGMQSYKVQPYIAGGERKDIHNNKGRVME